jgi:hypothetical protein
MGEIMKGAGGEGAVKKLAKRRLDAVGNIQAHCVELSDPVRQKRLRTQLELAASIAEISRMAAQESKEKKAQDGLELDKALPDAIVKLKKHNCDFSKLFVKELRAVGWSFCHKDIPNDKKSILVEEVQQLYNASRTIRDSIQAAINALGDK